jgi:hypothetical protein
MSVNSRIIDGRLDIGRSIDILIRGYVDARVGDGVFIPVYIRVYHHVTNHIYWRVFEEINR